MRRILAVAAVVGLVAMGSHEAAAQKGKPGACAQNVVVNFPTTGTAQTQWDLCFDVVPKHGLVITRGSFRPGALAAQLEVLADARVAEIFVPHHTGAPRLYEVSGAGSSLRTLTLADCPASAGGTLLAGNAVCRQVRDRGIAWHKRAKVRRGEEVVLWGVLQAGSAQYIIEWTFRDDGEIQGRVGRTGPALSSPGEGRMHDVTWRLDIDLNGAEADTAHWTRHQEAVPTATDPGTSATDEEVLVSREASLVWNPTEFTTVTIGDATLVNANLRPVAYELVPIRMGTARHEEPFTQADFWLTRYHPGELSAVALPSYVNGERLNKRDIVLWYTGSIHEAEGLPSEEVNAVPVTWVGFAIEPQNVFATTPLFP